MHGDFSRAHAPDKQRGERYLRGFAQQRRLMLDSDLNAMTDAIHERLRELSRHMGCPKGSPDLGYLVTPGQLLALFRDLDDVVIASSQVTIVRDYQHKYLDRYPSLRVAADQGAPGSVTIGFRVPASGLTVFWCRADVPTNVTVGSTTVAVPSGDLQPVAVDVGTDASDIQITLSSGTAIWIGMIETQQLATSAPKLCYAGGHYYLDGLPLEASADAIWTSNLVPPAAEFSVPTDPPRDLAPPADPAKPDKLLAYLEGWERHITAVEDPGIMENALGGDTDTTTRGRAIGQVKLAWVPPDFDESQFAHALANPALGDGTLDVLPPQVTTPTDECDLPVQEGYSGSDNRLYRFEVHTEGALGTATIKWSRDNGAELFKVKEAATDQELKFPASTPLRGGDLVEVLTEAIVEGDASPGELSTANSQFTPPNRAVGQLVELESKETSQADVTFTLLDPDTNNPAALDTAKFGPFPNSALVVRRWHGHIRTTALPDPNEHTLENGLTIKLAGNFAPGDYWQYEARVGQGNSNGSFQTAPHGPERDFAPLALLRFEASNSPLVLERWLDNRFPPLCGLTADDIAFDGARIDADGDTVQEVIEELWERVGGGCCEYTLSPPQGDAAVEIQKIIDDSPGEVTICLEPGVYRLSTALDISNGKVSLKGCPRAVLTTNGIGTLISVKTSGRLDLENLTLFSNDASNERVLVDVQSDAESVEARSVEFFAVPPDADPPSIAIRLDKSAPVAIDPKEPVPVTTTTSVNIDAPRISLYRCIIGATWGIAAAALSGLAVSECFFSCGAGCVWADALYDCRIRATNLLAGVDLTAMQLWTPDGLLTNGMELVDELASVVRFDTASAQSVCVRALKLRLATIEECILAAGLGLAASSTDWVTLHGNTYRVTETGVYLGDCVETALHGERIVGTGTAKGLETATGVAVAVGGGFSMTDSSVSVFNVGLALGIDAKVQDSRDFSNVQVQVNRFDATIVGVQLGPSSLGSYAGILHNVVISENCINAVGMGVMINALAVAGDGADSRSNVRVTDNAITSRVGVGVLGRNIDVSDNRIELAASASGPVYGVAAQDADGLVCDGNHVQLHMITKGLEGYYETLLQSGITAVGAFKTYVTGGPAARAIHVVRGESAKVTNNVVHTDESGKSMTGIYATAHPQLAIKDNEFLAGSCECGDTDGIVFLSNTVVGNVRIRSANGGMVCDNRIRAGGSTNTAGDLRIDSASGNWKVADNVVDGTVRVVPRIVSTGLNWGKYFGYTPSVAETGYPFSETAAVHEIAALANDKKFTEAMLADADRAITLSTPGIRRESPALVVGEQPATLRVAEAAAANDAVLAADSTGRTPVLMALSDDNWETTFDEALREYVMSDLRITMTEVDPNFVEVVIANSQEDAYQLMCTANWVQDLRIGAHGAQVSPNQNSRVQVVANHAGDLISIQRYRNRVVAMNIAHRYEYGISPQSTEIVEHNLTV